MRFLRGFLISPSGIPLVILILLLAVLSILSIPGVIENFGFIFDLDGNFTVDPLVSIVNGRLILAFIAIGIVILMINGEFDLSVGPVMVMGAYIFGSLSVGNAPVFEFQLTDTFSLFGPFLIEDPINPVLAMLVALAACSLMSMTNGLIVTFLRIPSFIASLGMLFVFLWVVSLYSGAAPFAVSDSALEERGISTLLYDIFAIQLREIPFVQDWAYALSPSWNPETSELSRFEIRSEMARWGLNLRVTIFWLIGIVTLMYFVMTRTKFGNAVYAVGGNPEAAKSQGINVRGMKIATFALTGFFAGFAGIVLFSITKSVNASSGNEQELFAIAAAVIGGTLLTGGFGSVVGGMIGVFILSTLNSGAIRLSTPLSNSIINDIPAIGPILVSLTSSSNFIGVVGLTIVGAAILNTYIRRRL